MKSGGLRVFTVQEFCRPNSQIRVLRSAIHSTLSAVALMHIFMSYQCFISTPNVFIMAILFLFGYNDNKLGVLFFLPDVCRAQDGINRF